MDTIRTLAESSEFWAAIAGALVGGGLTAVGGFLVYRRQAIREVRARIFEELLPAVPGGDLSRSTNKGRGASNAGLGHYILETLVPIHRASYLAARADRRKVEQLQKKAEALEELRKKAAPKFDGMSGQYVWDDPEAGIHFESQAERILEAVAAYRDWLGEKL